MANLGLTRMVLHNTLKAHHILSEWLIAKKRYFVFKAINSIRVRAFTRNALRSQFSPLDVVVLVVVSLTTTANEQFLPHYIIKLILESAITHWIDGKM